MTKLTDNNIQSLISKFKGKTTPKMATKVDNVCHALDSLDPRYLSFEKLPLYTQIKLQIDIAKKTGISQPYFTCHDGIAKDTTLINGEEYLNFSSYDYLGLNGTSILNDVAKKAIDVYGTSAGASRLVAGERKIHRILEKSIAQFYGQEDALTFVSGYGTNVSVISTLFTSEDVIFVDQLCHNSIMIGAIDSGAKRIVYPHNDMAALRNLLKTNRLNYKRALIVSEGVFSMDGNIADLPSLISLKKEFGCFLMLDEAHALGIIGETGKGTFEYFNVDSKDVDIWMGTLSKTLCACGGYIAGASSLIELLKFKASAFVYSVALSPSLAAVANEVLSIISKDYSYTKKLQENSEFAKEYADTLMLDTGLSQKTAILPIIVGSSLTAGFLSNMLSDNQICALPIIYPVVSEGQARIRLFLSAAHSKEQIKYTLDKIKSLIPLAQEKARNFSVDNSTIDTKEI